MESFISFPALGWKFAIDDTLVSFSLFGNEFTVKWYGVIIALGFLLAVTYGLKRARSFDIDPDRMIDVVLVCTVIGFAAARLYYVLFSEDRASYFADPITILYIWEGGIGIYGGIIGAFLSGVLMCKLRKVDLAPMMDLAALGFLIGQGIGRWGNFFNQEAFGGNTTLPWGMSGNVIQSGANTNAIVENFDPSLPVHPTFLYESLWCLLGFVLLHVLSKKAYKFKGQIFSLYLTWYGIGRFFIELTRTDSLMMGKMKVSCFVAVLTVLLGLMLYMVFQNKSRRLPRTLTPAVATITLQEDEAIATETEEDDITAEDVAELAALDGAEEEDITNGEDS